MKRCSNLLFGIEILHFCSNVVVSSTYLIFLDSVFVHIPEVQAGKFSHFEAKAVNCIVGKQRALQRYIN